MSDLDPNAPGVTETRTTYVPGGAAVEVSREVRPNRTAWWVSGMVAVAAIVAAVVLLNHRSAPTPIVAATDPALSAAAAQGAAQVSAQDAQAAAQQAQTNAQATQMTAAQSLADRAAADRQAAETAAQRAQDAAASVRNQPAPVTVYQSAPATSDTAPQ